MSPDPNNIFGNKYPKPLQPLAQVPTEPTPTQMSRIPWVQLPGWAQAHLRSWMREKRPGIANLAYHWDCQLTSNGLMSVLKHAGVD